MNTDARAIQNNSGRIWMCVAPWLLYGCDITATLASQSGDYWNGAYRTVEEGNPLAWFLLIQGPILFLTVALCWAAVYSAIILVGRHSLAVVLSFGLTFGHALGTACWLLRYGFVGIVSAILILFMAERILTWSWSKASFCPLIRSA